jgi:hypothetical protein
MKILRLGIIGKPSTIRFFCEMSFNVILTSIPFSKACASATTFETFCHQPHTNVDFKFSFAGSELNQGKCWALFCFLVPFY